MSPAARRPRKNGKKRAPEKEAADKVVTAERPAKKKPAEKKPAKKKPAEKKPAKKRPPKEKPAKKITATKKVAAPTKVAVPTKKTAAKKTTLKKVAAPKKAAVGRPIDPTITGAVLDGVIPGSRPPIDNDVTPADEVDERPDPIAALRRDLPVALLPIRLVTRFMRTRADRPPNALRIRILPDPIMIDSHRQAVTSYEAELGRAYWTRCFEAAGDPNEAEAATDWLTDVLGRPRARWVALKLRPRNAEDIGSTRVPKFPKPLIDDVPDPALVQLLPDQWVVEVRTGNEYQRIYTSAPVDRTHPVVAAPQLVDVGSDVTARSFLEAQGLKWRFDFDAAKAAGMAVEIPVDGEARIAGFSEVIVFGVRHGDHSKQLATLLSHHRYGEGFDLLPTGTPTNNTDVVTVPRIAAKAPEFASQPSAPSEAPKPASGPDVYTLSNADTAGLALGLRSTAAFDGAAIAERIDGVWSAATNQLLWPGITTQLFDQLLGSDKPVLAADDWTWLRDWFVGYVRGGPLLPTLAVGDLPYGLLPATTLPSAHHEPTAGDPLSNLEVQVAIWEEAWQGSRATSISPLLEGAATEVDHAIEVAGVLGAVPNPTSLRVRGAALERDRITDDFVAAASLLDEMVNALPVPLGSSLQTRYEEHLQRTQGTSTAGTQRNSLGTMLIWFGNHEANFKGFSPNPVTQVIEHVEGVMYPMLNDHDSRSWALHSVPGLGIGKLPTPSDPALWYTNYSDLDPDAPTVSLLGDRKLVRESLLKRVDQVKQKAKTGDVTLDDELERPLLLVLIDQSIRYAAKGAEQPLIEALHQLVGLIDDHEDALDILDRIARETIGVFTHRVDAWRTSIAAKRLADLRAKRPRGVQVGCFGLVVDLVPDDGTPDTQGFVHAPTLDHAATAAILRSAWQGLSGSMSDSAFAVDLSSDRVRRANWLLDGLRNGHELGDLLGQRLERRLHDAGLDAFVHDIREAVLAASGESRPASGIVDGLAIAEAYRASAAGSDLHNRLEAIGNDAGGDEHDALNAVFMSTEGDFDAVADLLMANGVLALLQGNVDAAGASVATVGSNPGGVVEPTIASLPSGGNVVTHRLLAAVPADVGAEADTIAGVALGAVAGWLDTLIGDSSNLEITVEWSVDGTVEERQTVSLGELGVGSAHLISWCPPGVASANSPFAQFVGFVLGEPGDERDLAVDTSSLEDTLVVAGALRDAVGLARPLRAADLVDATAVEGTATWPAIVDIDELVERADLVAARLRSLAEAIATASSRIDVAADAALCDFGAVAAWCADGTEASAESVSASLRDRAELLDEASRVDADALSAAIGRAAGVNVPVAPRLTIPGSADLATAIEDGTSRLRDRAAGWLLASGRVHDGVDAVHQALLMSDTVLGRHERKCSLLQYPVVDDQAWAGLDLPDFGAWRTRLCLLSVTDLAAAVVTGAVSGLVFDGWTETVPGTELTTGVAVNFDSPSSRAPQSVVLAVPPPNRKWNSDLMVDVLHELKNSITHRAIGPETLESHGHLLPAVFIDDKARVLTEETVAELEKEGSK